MYGNNHLCRHHHSTFAGDDRSLDFATNIDLANENSVLL